MNHKISYVLVAIIATSVFTIAMLATCYPTKNQNQPRSLQQTKTRQQSDINRRFPPPSPMRQHNLRTHLKKNNLKPITNLGNKQHIETRNEQNIARSGTKQSSPRKLRPANSFPQISSSSNVEVKAFAPYERRRELITREQPRQQAGQNEESPKRASEELDLGIEDRQPTIDNIQMLKYQTGSYEIEKQQPIQKLHRQQQQSSEEEISPVIKEEIIYVDQETGVQVKEPPSQFEQYPASLELSVDNEEPSSEENGYNQHKYQLQEDEQEQEHLQKQQDYEPIIEEKIIESKSEIEIQLPKSGSSPITVPATILTEVPEKDMPPEVLKILKDQFGVKVIATREKNGSKLVMNCDGSGLDPSVCRQQTSQEAQADAQSYFEDGLRLGAAIYNNFTSEIDVSQVSRNLGLDPQRVNSFSQHQYQDDEFLNKQQALQNGIAKKNYNLSAFEDPSNLENIINVTAQSFNNNMSDINHSTVTPVDQSENQAQNNSSNDAYLQTDSSLNLSESLNVQVVVDKNLVSRNIPQISTEKLKVTTASTQALSNGKQNNTAVLVNSTLTANNKGLNLTTVIPTVKSL